MNRPVKHHTIAAAQSTALTDPGVGELGITDLQYVSGGSDRPFKVLGIQNASRADVPVSCPMPGITVGRAMGGGG